MHNPLGSSQGGCAFFTKYMVEFMHYGALKTMISCVIIVIWYTG